MTVLVDTSVWIDHLRRTNARLVDLLDQGTVVTHPFVIGELACGNLTRRDEILTLLQALPATPVVESDEALGFVTARHLHGRGLGWVDIHLLASALVHGSSLWSFDRALVAAAARLGLAAPLNSTA